MFSVDYIHKSQDALNRNLVNFKNYKGHCVKFQKLQRPLREAYAISYSVSPCEFL